MAHVRFGFYKCFSSQTSSQKLEIPGPEKFVLPSMVLLRNRFEQIWSIKIQEEGDLRYFNKGWEKFMADNSLADGDYLVFDYEGHGMFDFILLDGESKCEKNVPPAPPSRAVKIKTDADDVEAAQMDLDNKFAVEVEKKDDEMDDDTEEEVKVESTDDEDYHVDFANSRGRRSSSRLQSKRAAGEGSSIEKVKDVPDHYGADLFKSGRYAKPTNPYFVTKLRKKRRNDLYLPMDVVNNHNLVLPPTLILRDPRGKEWTMKLRIWSDGRTWLTGGWKNLCRWNLVEKDDRCICEFLPHTAGQDMVLQVTTIVRADEAH